MTDPRTLLSEYIANGSEEAFRELSARYVNLAYATAVRLMNGDTHRAEDVVQTVFMDLARLARTLSPDVMLGGWVHRRTCHVAATLIRGERRRQKREQQAAQMSALDDPTHPNFRQIVPVLDDAINHLNAADRAAIVLRYFEARDLRSVGEALGASEDAAQKRVSRALEKLRVLLKRRGVIASGSALSIVLSAQSATVAPLSLAASVSTATLAGASQSGGLTLTLLKITTMTKLKLAAGVAVAAVVGTVFISERQTWAELRDQQASLQQQMAKFQNMPQNGFESPTVSAKPVPLDAEQRAELEKLQREIESFRRQTGEVTALRAENAKLKALGMGGESSDPVQAEFAQETRHRLQSIKKWGLMFRMYANDHQGQLPQTWDEVAEHIPAPERESFIRFAKENFEITYQGNEERISPDRVGAILFREKQPRRSPAGKLVKVYGHFDGSASTRNEPQGGFEAFEKENMIVPR